MTDLCYFAIRVLILMWYVHCLGKQMLMIKPQKTCMEIVFYKYMSETQHI